MTLHAEKLAELASVYIMCAQLDSDFLAAGDVAPFKMYLTNLVNVLEYSCIDSISCA